MTAFFARIVRARGRLGTGTGSAMVDVSTGWTSGALRRVDVCSERCVDARAALCRPRSAQRMGGDDDDVTASAVRSHGPSG